MIKTKGKWRDEKYKKQIEKFIREFQKQTQPCRKENR